ncbi:MAG: YwqG family protein [Bacteroidota bacterium]
MKKFDRIEKQVVKYLVESHPIEASDLLELLAPCLAIDSLVRKSIIKPKSKFGGFPDVPGDFEWPLTKTGQPLSFISQLNLKQVAETNIVSALPKFGMLYFFIYTGGINRYPKLSDEFFVFYCEKTNGLDNSSMSEVMHFDEVAINFKPSFSLPGWSSYLLRNRGELAAIIEDCKGELNEIMGREEDNYNQFLGHLQPVQGDLGYLWSKDYLYPEVETLSKTQIENIFAHESKVINLLQLDFENSESNFSEFGGNGIAYFGIKEEDLNNGDFSKVFFSIQST